MLKKTKLPKSFKIILRGFKSQAYCEADMQKSRILQAVQHSLHFYQKVAPYISVDSNCEVL